MSKLSKAELNRLLAEVTEDVAALLKHEATESKSLSKADPGTEAPGEETPEGSSTSPKEESAPPFAASADPAGAPAGAAGPETSAAPEAAPAGADGAGDPAEQKATPEQLQAEYQQLPPEELMAHIQASLAAAQALGLPVPGAGGAPEASAPAAAPAPAPAAPGPEMGKGEFDDKSGEVKAGSMGKSEKDILSRLTKAEAALGEIENLRKAVSERDAKIASMETSMSESIGKIANGVKKIVLGQQAMRKSVAGVGYMAKPGTEIDADLSSLTKSEVVSRLGRVTSKPDLSLEDRKIINEFVIGSNPDVRVVAKFLK
jgi:hypothetical protein